MTPFYTDDWLQIYEGDCAVVLPDLPQVHTVITSPPYYGLRDYGVDGQLGLEDTPEEYVAHLVEIGRAVRHVLRDDGIFWLNLGDSYSAGGRGGGADGSKQATNTGALLGPKRAPVGYKPKDLLGIPWMVAFALRADGWYLRRDIIWAKPNPMPESVDDRCTSSHEYIFMLAKKPDYFYDGFAIREPISEAMQLAIARGTRPDKQYQHDTDTRMGKRSGNRAFSDVASLARIGLGRTKRSVWTIPTVAYPGAHFATFPPKLVEPMIMASTSERGCCPVCGAQWTRIVESSAVDHHETYREGKTAAGPYAAQADIRNGSYVDARSVGWAASCRHEEEPVPCTVLDPFAGSGTVGMVASKLSRKAIMIDINPEYLRQQMVRTRQVPLGL